jgi:ferredoxin-NADP reductase
LYRIAILDQPDGRGGSHAAHQVYQVGLRLNCQLPDNYFSMQTDKHTEGRKAIIVAGGVGITPMLAMVKEAEQEGFTYDMHYAARNKQSAAFYDEIKSSEYNAQFYFSDDDKRLNLKELIANANSGDIIYICGPVSMIAAAQEAAVKAGLAPNQLVFETFDDT